MRVKVLGGVMRSPSAGGNSTLGRERVVSGSTPGRGSSEATSIGTGVSATKSDAALLAFGTSIFLVVGRVIFKSCNAAFRDVLLEEIRNRAA